MYEVSESDRKVIDEEMARQGIKHYGMQQGNGCVWVWYGRVNAYYFIQDNKIVSVQID